MVAREVISGGQSRVDQAAWRAARACGIPTGATMPPGFLTEDGPRPRFAEEYGAVAQDEGGYPERTRKNVEDADATLWLGRSDSAGGRATERACDELGREFFVVLPGFVRPSAVASWIEAEEIRTLNCAGNRESVSPGIGERSERFLLAVFRRLTR